jgi:hypothetical protein
MAERKSRIWVPGWVRLLHALRALLHLPQAERALRQAAPELEALYLEVMATEGATASSYAPRELQRARERAEEGSQAGSGVTLTTSESAPDSRSRQ